MANSGDRTPSPLVGAVADARPRWCRPWARALAWLRSGGRWANPPVWGGIALESYGKAWAAIGFRGPWILECAVGLREPSLESRAVDPAALRQALRVSVDWLRQHLASAPDSAVQAERSSP